MNKFGKVIGGIILVGGLLVGCGQQQTSAPAPTHKTEQAKPTPKTDQWKQDQNDSVKTNQPAESTSVFKTIATNKAVDQNPVKVNIDSITFKKAINVPQDEIDRMNNLLGYHVTGNSFNYISIQYTATNTSPKDIDFDGITKVVIISGDQQEVLGTNTNSIVNNDPNYDGVFYGQVTKKGNDGYIFMTDPSKITKIIITVGGTMEAKVYTGGSPDTDITFTP